MGNSSFVNQTPDDEFQSDAAQAAIAADEFADAAAASAAAAAASAASVLNALDDYLELAGGTMTGSLILAGNPTIDLEAATKQYVDDLVDDYLPLAGGTLTGSLILDADPVADLEAATKQYVDNIVPSANVEYDITMYFEGTMEDGFEQLALLVCSTPFSLASGLSGAQAYALTAPDANTVLSIERNNVEIGTITFAAASNTGTFSFTSDVDFVAGDRLEVVGPEYADIYLSDVSITLPGQK